MFWKVSGNGCCTYRSLHLGETSGPITRGLLFLLSPFLRIWSLTGTNCSGVLHTGLFMAGLFGTSRPSIGQSNAFKNEWKTIRTMYESCGPSILHPFSKNWTAEPFQKTVGIFCIKKSSDFFFKFKVDHFLKSIQLFKFKFDHFLNYQRKEAF